MTLDRRQFLTLSGTALGALGLGATGCSRSSSRDGSAGQSTGSVQWWDHFEPLRPLHQRLFDEFTVAHPGARVEQTVYNPADLGQALQLAQRANQLPDIYTTVGLGLPERTLHDQQWIAPLQLTDEQRGRLDESLLLEGLHLFDGRLHSFPIFTFRQHNTLTWFNRPLVEAAGGDPENGPATWDDFRAIGRRVATGGSGEAFGWIQGLAYAERLGTHLIDLAQAAGAELSLTSTNPDVSGMTDARTGEYAFASEPFVAAMEFLKSLVVDKLVFPASTSLDAKAARARWTTGAAAFFFDGPWNVGIVLDQFGPFADSVGVAGVPSPDGRAVLHKGPPPGQFWLSHDSADPELASQLLGELTSDAYHRGLAQRQDQPPLRTEVVTDADVHPMYKRAVGLFEKGVRLAPSPIGRNPAVGSVIAEMATIRPDIGEITQGYLSGDITDVRAALQEFSGKLAAERDRAVDVVRASGAEVGLQDWVFEDFVADSDYAVENYAR